VTTSPKYPLRGHQLGYRPKTNSYDAWDVGQWEQYIRDLAVWGTNAIELIPPRSDDDGDSPHFPLPPMKMMIEMSRICAEYGLDVWIWYPALDKDYADPATVEFALKEWGEVFRQLPRIDAVFVPGGIRAHPAKAAHEPAGEADCQPPSLSSTGGNVGCAAGIFAGLAGRFMEIVRREPQWLSGIVYGPQSRLTLPRMRAAVPAKYPIRHYPDITHTRQSQFPVVDWDLAFALTEAREPINPRPTDEAHIFRMLQKDTNGFITYSEGCNDDVNKIVWSALGWNPECRCSRSCVSTADTSSARRLRTVSHRDCWRSSENWRGPVISNHGIEVTLRQFPDAGAAGATSRPAKLAFSAGALPRLL
jgi:hypothetical protein